VKVVSSATEALEVFERYQIWPPDILVSDIQMPAIDGYELMRRVRNMGSDRGGNIPAIALTAYTRDEDRACALVAGFQIHVAKPFDPFELLTIVENMVNRRTED
jgi:CheY-like chemotaxis protein